MDIPCGFHVGTTWELTAGAVTAPHLRCHKTCQNGTARNAFSQSWQQDFSSLCMASLCSWLHLIAPRTLCVASEKTGGVGELQLRDILTFWVHTSGTHFCWQPLVIVRPCTSSAACLARVGWTVESACICPCPPPSCLSCEVVMAPSLGLFRIFEMNNRMQGAVCQPMSPPAAIIVWLAG